MINVASGDPQSVNRLVELLGSPSVPLPKRPGEPDCTWARHLEGEAAAGMVARRFRFEDGVARMLERIERLA